MHSNKILIFFDVVFDDYDSVQFKIVQPSVPPSYEQALQCADIQIRSMKTRPVSKNEANQSKTFQAISSFRKIRTLPKIQSRTTRFQYS
mmetsp:Transcript_15774/g.32695  ORF Transcript_15774/g.32695 Transcript_15774/m.32695 type:complete len:89 (-) Transcript_15774:1256-1522(-)